MYTAILEVTTDELWNSGQSTLSR